MNNPDIGCVLIPFFQRFLQINRQWYFMAFLILFLCEIRPEIPFDIFDITFHAALVFRFPGKAGADQKIIMLGKFLITSIDNRVIKGRFYNCRFEIVRDNLSGYPSKVMKSMYMAKEKRLFFLVIDY